MHAIRRDDTTLTSFPTAPTASGMPAVMLEKQLGQWDHVWRALCPLVIADALCPLVIVDATDAVGTVDRQKLRSVKTAAER